MRYLAIQGSFEAYVWAALWHVTLGGLQAGAPALFSETVADNTAALLRYAVSLTGSVLSWCAWGLSLWVVKHDGFAAGILFGIFCFFVNALTLIELHRLPQYALPAQISSIAYSRFSPS